VVCVKLPELPVTVTVPVPVVAVLLALNVNVLVLAVLPGLNDAVTPLGKPDADKLTLPVNPFCGLTVIVLVPLPPCTIVTLPGDAESAKFGTGTAFTVRETVVVLLKLPDTPVTVSVAVPVVAVPLALSVNVLVLAVLPGLNAAVTPLGKPEADKLTLPVNPFCGVTVTVLVPLPPCTTVTLPGDAESAKFGPDTTPGQLFTKLAALTLPIPVAKSQPMLVPYADANDVLEVESTPTDPSAR
jgi:hypothetical protein